MRIRAGDNVIVTVGTDRGTQPRRVIKVVPGGEKIVVQGVNRVFKHVKRGHPKSPSGGRLQMEMPINASNVLLVCPACSKGTRVGVRYEADGAKVRYCKKCNANIGNVSPAKPAYAQQAGA